MNKMAEAFNKLVLDIMEENEKSNNLNTEENWVAASALIQFSADEIEQMGNVFKEVFRAEGGSARILKYQVGKRKPTYEIRYCRHGINISVKGKDLKKAKELFIKKTVRLCSEPDKT